jgi:hypothetical protein
VVERGESASLAIEPLGDGRIARQLRQEHLDGDIAAKAQVVTAVHGSHPSGPELAVDPVSPSELLSDHGHAGEPTRWGLVRASV